MALTLHKIGSERGNTMTETDHQENLDDAINALVIMVVRGSGTDPLHNLREAVRIARAAADDSRDFDLQFRVIEDILNRAIAWGSRKGST